MPTYTSPFSEESVTFTSPFTGTVVTPTDVSYYALTLTSDVPLFWPSSVNQGLGQVPAARIIDCLSSATAYSPSSNTTTTFTISGTMGTRLRFVIWTRCTKFLKRINFQTSS